jgi:hypothetical protein
MLAGLVNYADRELTEHGGMPAIVGDGDAEALGTIWLGGFERGDCRELKNGRAATFWSPE